MNKKSFIFKIVLISLILNISCPVFAQSSIKEEEDETPLFIKDLRRFEIITLGSLPFVLLDSTLVYSGIKYAQNDFDSAYIPSLNQSNFSKKEQTGVLLTSLGICLGIGLTDLIVNIVKRNKAKKVQELRNGPIEITPLGDPNITTIYNEENIILLDNEQNLTNNEDAENEE